MSNSTDGQHNTHVASVFVAECCLDMQETVGSSVSEPDSFAFRVSVVLPSRYGNAVLPRYSPVTTPDAAPRRNASEEFYSSLRCHVVMCKTDPRKQS